MKKLSKRMAALSTKIEDRIYAPLEALSIIKENANAKFDETVEAHIRLGIDPKYTDQQLRTTVALPHGTGQSIKIAVITSGENVSKARLLVQIYLAKKILWKASTKEIWNLIYLLQR